MRSGQACSLARMPSRFDAGTAEAAMGRAPDGDLLFCRREQIENIPMVSFSAEPTQSWFVAKVAVALSPVVILTTADVIGWLMRMLRRHTAKAPQSEP